MIAIVLAAMIVIISCMNVNSFKKKAVQSYENETYADLKAEKLLKDKRKLDYTRDKNIRQVYITGIFQEFKGFNPDYIKNRKLRKFLVNINNGKIY